MKNFWILSLLLFIVSVTSSCKPKTSTETQTTPAETQTTPTETQTTPTETQTTPTETQTTPTETQTTPTETQTTPTETQTTPPTAKTANPLIATPTETQTTPPTAKTANPLIATATATPKAETETLPSSNEQIDICLLSPSFQKAVLSALNIEDCNKADLSAVSQIKKLKLENIQAEEDIFPSSQDIALFFPSLEELDFSDNLNLFTIPQFVFNTKIKKLDISRTAITNIEDSICQLKDTLISLKASHNTYQGDEIPIAVFCLLHLKTLDMSFSNLQYIDEYIYYLQELEELYLNTNNLMIAPQLLQLLSSLLVLDLSENQFENKKVNSLIDCKTDFERDSSEQKKCQTDLADTVSCEYWHKAPFQRGQALRDRYEEMTGDTYRERQECQECAHCYNFWLNNYVSYYDSNKAYLWDLTINGKTIREWRLVMDKVIEENVKYWNCQNRIKGISFEHEGVVKSLINFFIPRNTSYGPNNQEVYPERYRSFDWNETPAKCKAIQHKIPISEYEKPWELELPAVQEVIDTHYPSSLSCENWPILKGVTAIWPHGTRCPIACIKSKEPDCLLNHLLGPHSAQHIHEDEKNDLEEKLQNEKKTLEEKKLQNKNNDGLN